MSLRTVLNACGVSLFRFDHLLAGQASLLAGLPGRWKEERSTVLDLSTGFEAYLAGQRAHSRSLLQTTARKTRKLEREQGAVRLVFHRADHDMLDRLLRWKSDQYRRTGRRDRFADHRNRALLHRLLEVQEPGFGASLTVLEAGASVVAAHLGLRGHGVLAWWFPVYDPAFAAYSPGIILCLELAKAMGDHDLSVLDLGKGDEAYKERLGNAEIRLLSGFAALNRRSAAMVTVRRWPVEQANDLVLRTPVLRRGARRVLARVGSVRQGATRAR